MRKTKVDIFLETGLAICNHHGSHSEWGYNKGKKKFHRGKWTSFRSIQCRKCGVERNRKHLLKNPTASDDYRFSFNGIIVRMLAQARVRARKRGHEFELNSEWVKEVFIKQNYKCSYSGIQFDFSRPEYDKNRKYLPSIDQKVIGLGYTKANSEIVCSIVNMMKLDTPHSEFLTICEHIVKFNKI